MRFKILKKLSISLIICLSALTPFADAKTISTDKYDLDLNGTKEWIQVNVKKVDEYTSLPEYIEIKYNVPGSSVPSSYGRLDIPGEDKLAYNNIKVVDINLNDEQKEILLMLRGTEYFYNEIQLYTLTNKKLRYIGKIESGSVKLGDDAVIVNYNDSSINKKIKITKIYEFENLSRKEVESSSVGNIIAVTGVEGISIGDTLCSIEDPTPLPFVKISEPTLAMNFIVNNSPFAGKEGKFVTSRQIRARLYKELETDVSLRVEDTDSTDSFRVSGRGELHLSVLIENMRREGYEFQVSKPEVLYKKDENGKLLEPIETVTIDVDQEFVGSVIEKLGQRKADLINMNPSQAGYTRLIFNIPARGLIGYRSEFKAYEPFKGEIPTRNVGSLICFETGVATAYGLNSAQERGTLFISPQAEVYEGMVVGSNAKGLDIEVNVCKKKQQTNIRSSASDDALKLSPPKIMSLEEMLEFIESDEYIEVTPQSLRMRKKILDSQLRYKSKKNNK